MVGVQAPGCRQGPGQHVTGGGPGEAEDLAGVGGWGAAGWVGGRALCHQVGETASDEANTEEIRASVLRDSDGVA